MTMTNYDRAERWTQQDLDLIIGREIIYRLKDIKPTINFKEC